MKYLRKKSIRLRRIAARRLKTLRKQLRKIDLSHSIELNLLIIKLEFNSKRPVVTLPGCNSTASARLAC